ncbi:MAG: B12-binding domain-containing radical SAM protein, partial [Candidatus Latescibacteria bacterium]|nr:B12-binding domain-containing radical SAM protein [Candidatus Latescibacterota bacterium]
MKICYLDISASYSHRSLALPMLHLACDGKVDIEWSVVHSTINDDVHAISARVLETQPDVVLGTLFLFTHVQMLRTLRRVRAVLPETQIFLGGPEFLGENEDFLRRENFVDAVCRGEGELALPKLLQSRADKSVWSDLPGLCWLGDEGAYFDNGTGALNED